MGSNINIVLYKRHIINDVAAECNLLGRTLETTGNDGQNSGANALKELAGYIKSPSDNETKPVVARAMSEGFNAVKEACQRYLVMGRDVDDNRLESLFTPSSLIKVQEMDEFTDRGNWADTTPDGTVTDCNTIDVLDVVKGVEYTINVYRSFTGLEGTFKVYAGNAQVGTFAITGSELVTFKWTAQESASVPILISANGNDEVERIVSQDAFRMAITWEDFGQYELELDIFNFNTGVTSSLTSYAHRLIVDHVMAAILKNQQVETYRMYVETEGEARNHLVHALQARRTFERSTHDWK